MNFQEIFNTYLELKNNLIEKKEAIIKKDIEKLGNLEENCLVLCEKIKKFNIDEIKENFSNEEKTTLKELGLEIKNIQENNEILIKHSLGVINNILSGILNIAQKENQSYNAKGKGYSDNESLDISSITEEA